MHAWTAERGTKSGYNLKWRLAAIRDAMQAQGLPERRIDEAAQC